MGMASRGGYSREDPVAQNAIKAVGLHLAITEPYCLSVHTAWLPCGEWRLPVPGPALLRSQTSGCGRTALPSQ